VANNPPQTSIRRFYGKIAVTKNEGKTRSLLASMGNLLIFWTSSFS